MIRVLVVDDHAMFAETLVRLLTEDATIEVIGNLATAASGIEAARAERPDIVLMDFGLPDMNGAEATRVLGACSPEIKVVILTGSEHPGAYYTAIEAGAAGWVRKTRAVHDLLSVIHQVHRGEVIATDELADLPTAEQLVVHYQPIIELATDEIAGFEALVRWQHPEQGLIMPAQFLPRAEETGFVNELGQVVGRTASRQLVVWQCQLKAARRLWVSVNISASGVKREALVREVAAVIDGTGVDPHDLVLEVTETVLLADADAALAQLRRLKEFGVRLALDDFGTGFSSLSYLREFPFDLVKLDMAFTAELPHSARAMRLVDAIHNVVTALDMDGIAEGVEREDQARALTDLGWRYAQGYLYSRPVDAETATRQLSMDIRGC